jgi:hypothetical protein
VKIKVERSGGVAGIPLCIEMDSKDLPSSLVTKVKKIIVDKNTSSLPMKSAPRGAADHYTFKISIQDGVNRSVIECDQYDLQDDLKLFVKYVEKNSKNHIR